MCGHFVTVRPDPRNLSLKHCDPLTQFVLRIGIKAFLSQRTGRIAFGPRQIVFHYGQRIGRGGLAVNRVSS